MPKRIKGITPRVLECAKKEFMEKGFQQTSIRIIAKNAETSPRAIYTRFPDKLGLFSALVEPAVSEFKTMVQNILEENWRNSDGSSITRKPIELDHNGYADLVDYIYDHIEEFTMVIKGSEGTPYASFVEELAEISTSYVKDSSAIDKVRAAGIRMARGESGGDTMARLYHILSHSFLAGIFEIVSHGMNREEAKFYARKITEFYGYGFLGILADQDTNN